MKETGRYGIEAYLKKQVKAAGGDTRKWVSPGHPGVPDQIVIWSGGVVMVAADGRTAKVFKMGDIHFVETKAPDGKPEPHQAREHDRLRALGCTVLVIDTKAKVDEYVEKNR